MAGVEFDKRVSRAIKNILKENPKWLVPAINDTVRGLRTDIGSDKTGVRKELNVTKKVVNKSISLKLAKARVLNGVVTVVGEPIPAYNKDKGWAGGTAKPGMNFQGRRTNRPRAKSKVTGKPMKGKAYKYSFMFKKDKGRKIFPGAFPAKMKSGHVGIFIREDRKLKEIFSSNVAEVLGNEDISKLVLLSGSVRMTKNVEKQIKRHLK